MRHIPTTGTIPCNAYIKYVKEIDPESGRPYSLRYIGSLVADFHRNLISGGIFLYPRDKKSTDKPDGKLRLLYEAAPLAMIAEQAGGRAITDDGRNILDIEPKDLHQRVPSSSAAVRMWTGLRSFLNRMSEQFPRSPSRSAVRTTGQWGFLPSLITG